VNGCTIPLGQFEVMFNHIQGGVAQQFLKRIGHKLSIERKRQIDV